MFNRDLLGKRIRKARGKKSQDVFAAELGISRGALSFYENGERLPDAKIIYKICECCNVSAGYLLGFTDDTPNVIEKNLTKTAVYPGSFDPITNGHIDIIKRAADIFDRVIVLISCNPPKSIDFHVSRAELAKEALKDMKNVLVDSWNGLLVDYILKVHACAIVRGLRAVSDFEYEFQMAAANKSLYNGAETVFLTASTENTFISSSMVKQIARFGGDVSKFVPNCVETKLKEMYALCHQ